MREVTKQIVEKATKVPSKYVSGLSEDQKKKRKKEIRRRAKDKSPDYSPLPGDDKAKTKPSKYSRSTLAKKVREQMKGNSDDEFIRTVAKLTGISSSIIRSVHKRGAAAWESGHRPGATQAAWSRARVYSFATGGKTRSTADADLWKKHKRGQVRKAFEAHYGEIKRWSPADFVEQVSHRTGIDDDELSRVYASAHAHGGADVSASAAARVGVYAYALVKARPRKYRKRIATGNPRRPWRYVYDEPKDKKPQTQLGLFDWEPQGSDPKSRLEQYKKELESYEIDPDDLKRFSESIWDGMFPSTLFRTSSIDQVQVNEQWNEMVWGATPTDALQKYFTELANLELGFLIEMDEDGFRPRTKSWKKLSYEFEWPGDFSGNNEPVVGENISKETYDELFPPGSKLSDSSNQRKQEAQLRIYEEILKIDADKPKAGLKKLEELAEKYALRKPLPDHLISGEIIMERGRREDQIKGIIQEAADNAVALLVQGGAYYAAVAKNAGMTLEDFAERARGTEIGKDMELYKKELEYTRKARLDSDDINAADLDALSKSKVFRKELTAILQDLKKEAENQARWVRRELDIKRMMLHAKSEDFEPSSEAEQLRSSLFSALDALVEQIKNSQEPHIQEVEKHVAKVKSRIQDGFVDASIKGIGKDLARSVYNDSKVESQLGHWGSATTKNSIAITTSVVGDGGRFRPVDYKLDLFEIDVDKVLADPETLDRKGFQYYDMAVSKKDLKNAKARYVYAQKQLETFTRGMHPTVWRGMKMPRQVAEGLKKGDLIPLTGCTAYSFYKHIAEQYSKSDWTSGKSEKDSISCIIELERDQEFDDTIAGWHHAHSSKEDPAFEIVSGANAWEVLSVESAPSPELAKNKMHFQTHVLTSNMAGRGSGIPIDRYVPGVKGRLTRTSLEGYGGTWTIQDGEIPGLKPGETVEGYKLYGLLEQIPALIKIKARGVLE